MSKKSKDINTFVENIRYMSTYCQINIYQLNELMMELIYRLIKEKVVKGEFFKLLETNCLYGLCPKCGIKTKGFDLYIASFKEQAAKDIDITEFLMAAPREIKRLAEGKCAHPTCAEKQIEIHWDYINLSFFRSKF